MRKLLLLTLFLLLSTTGLAFAAGQDAAPLHLDVFNPGARSLFPVSSEIVSGPHQVVLIDAQFQTNDAQELVRRIRDTGKTLTTVYVSHSDPDYYFGLQTIHEAFPQARIVATRPTVEAMALLMAGKKAYWGPILKTNAPKALILPQVLQGNRIDVDGQPLFIEGLDGLSPERSFVWIPALRTVVGGAVVFSGTHVWVADTQTPVMRQHWQETLARIEQLHPDKVVPGHYLGDAPDGLRAVDFTARYLATFDHVFVDAKDSASLTDAMTRRYPDLASTASWLALGAKVVMGEQRWPQ